MGNDDGYIEARKAIGTNKVIEFPGGFFSFAFGNEIAFVLENKTNRDYYILNCSVELWNMVIEITKQTKNKRDLIKWWIEMSNNYEISDWCKGAFEKLRKIYNV